MKRYLIFIPAFILALAACQMPGVEQVAEQIESQVDDISGRMESVSDETDDLRDRIAAIENRITSAAGDIELPEFDTGEIMESLGQEFENLTARTDSLIGIATANGDSLAVELNAAVGEQALLIDSLKVEITSLKQQINSLNTRVNALGANPGDAGRTGSTSSSGGRGGTSGGSTGSSGGRI